MDYESRMRFCKVCPFYDEENLYQPECMNCKYGGGY